ncbi:MAG: P-type conjugative transfer protein TrbJ [Candidatus Margulisbacteria bacterium]|nr:P-type conjugative transfer protein TrbJ [Candidatus Margulisiibacteriota bacterium]
MKIHENIVVMILCALVLFEPVSGGGLPFIDATEWTQMLNNIELIGISYQELLQVQAQLQQLNNMVAHGMNLPDHIWGNTQSQLMLLANIVREGQALSYSASNIDSEFRRKFQNYGHYLENELSFDQFSNKYQDWSTTNLDTIKSSLKSANLQYQQFETEEQTMSLLQRQSETVQGRMQAIQVGNQIASQQVRQTQKLRSLIMSQMQMQAAYLASQTDKDSINHAQRVRLRYPSRAVPGNGMRF